MTHERTIDTAATITRETSHERCILAEKRIICVYALKNNDGFVNLLKYGTYEAIPNIIVNVIARIMAVIKENGIFSMIIIIVIGMVIMGW